MRPRLAGYRFGWTMLRSRTESLDDQVRAILWASSQVHYSSSDLTAVGKDQRWAKLAGHSEVSAGGAAQHRDLRPPDVHAVIHAVTTHVWRGQDVSNFAVGSKHHDPS